MATLYVENVPKELYEALRARARKNRRSMAAELVSLLEQAVPTAKELKRREQLLQQVLRLHNRASSGAGPFPTTEQMVREDRER
jgi:antitoxin FitA